MNEESSTGNLHCRSGAFHTVVITSDTEQNCK